jgi:hypothetical protein
MLLRLHHFAAVIVMTKHHTSFDFDQANTININIVIHANSSYGIRLESHIPYFCDNHVNKFWG